MAHTHRQASGSRPLGLATRVNFGIGSATESAFYIAFNVFCFFYYVQLLGLPAGLAGLAVSIALIFDAFSDPLIGYMSDRWKSARWGRRHPFMLIAAVPMMLSWIALFMPPEGLSEWQLFLWLTVFTIAARVIQTVFYVPHIAMGGELVDSYSQRSRVFIWHILFLWAGGAAVHYFGLRYFFPTTAEGANGMLVSDNYFYFGIIWGVVIAALMLISALGTVSRIPYLKEQPATRTLDTKKLSLSLHLQELVVEFKEILTNRNFLLVGLGLLAQATGAGIYETLLSHFNTYIWQFSTEQYSMLVYPSMLGFLIGFVCAVPLHSYLGKHTVLAVSTIGMGLAHVGAPTLYLTGFPLEPGSNQVLYLILASAALYYTAQSLMLVSVVSIIGDIADEHELNTGKRREGILYSSRTLFAKTSSAFGHLIAGLLLTIISFPTGKDAVPGSIPQQILDQLVTFYVLFIPLPYLIAGYLYSKYTLTEKRHQEILTALDTRKQ
ncbi:MAG: MFS transporter [Gammaproteobacteria bacterium]